MTTAQLAVFIGRVGLLRVSEHAGVLAVPIKVIDAKSAYGTIRYQVTPVHGQGKAWVTASRVQLTEEKRRG